MPESKPNTEDYDSKVLGERKSIDVGPIETGLEVDATRASVTASIPDDVEEVELYIPGERNTVRIKGTSGSVAFYHAGKSNSVIVDEKLDFTTKMDSGRSTSIKREELVEAEPEPEDDEEEDTVTPDDLIQTTKEEALTEVGLFGVSPIQYQTTAERDWCRFCGKDADAVVHRQEKKVLRLFGLTITMEEGSESDQCEHCADILPGHEDDLEEAARREAYGDDL